MLNDTEDLRKTLRVPIETARLMCTKPAYVIHWRVMELNNRTKYEALPEDTREFATVVG